MNMNDRSFELSALGNVPTVIGYGKNRISKIYIFTYMNIIQTFLPLLLHVVLKGQLI